MPRGLTCENVFSVRRRQGGGVPNAHVAFGVGDGHASSGAFDRHLLDSGNEDAFVSMNGRPSGDEYLGSVGRKTGNVLAKVHAVAGTPCNNRASILIECEYYFSVESVQATLYLVILFDK